MLTTTIDGGRMSKRSRARREASEPLTPLEAARERMAAEQRRVQGLLRAERKKDEGPQTAPGGRPVETVAVHAWEHGRYAGIPNAGRVVDTVRAMYMRRQISIEQLLAADKFREAWEANNSGMACALDLSRRGAGTSSHSPTDTQVWGAGMLKACRNHLGAQDHELLCLVVGEGQAIGDAARRVYGQMVTDADAKYAGRRFRDGLTALAGLWLHTLRVGRIRGTGSINQFDPDMLGQDEPTAGAHAGPDGVRRG